MKQKIEQSLKHSIEQLPHSSFEQLAHQPVNKMTEHDYITRQELPVRRKTQSRIAKLTIAFAAVVLMAGIGWFMQYGMIDSIIALDVNPSFEITSNRHEQVLQVKGLNDDAIALLEGRKYRGWNLDDALSSIFSDMANDGYISAQNKAVLLSVNCRDNVRGDQLKIRLSESINNTLLAKDIHPRIVRQNLTVDEVSRQRAAQYSVSEGKMQLVDSLLEKEPSFSEKSLSEMPLEDILTIAAKQGLVFDELDDLDDLEDVIEDAFEDDDDDDDYDDYDDDDDRQQQTIAGIASSLPSTLVKESRDDDRLNGNYDSDDDDQDDDNQNDDDQDDDD